MTLEKERVSKNVENLVRKLVCELKTHLGENLVSVALFGSFARGDFHECSDIAKIEYFVNIGRFMNTIPIVRK